MKHDVRIAGFRITVDPLLPVVILGIGWLLTARYMPGGSYVLGGVASLLLTVSILFHELGHAVVAQRLNLTIERIHLFLFGGMAELKHRPSTSSHEAMVALAGPLASCVLGVAALALADITPIQWIKTRLMLDFVAQMNLLLALFNLIPIFPLDGGRALRALLWKLTGRYTLASHRMHQISYVLIVIVLIIAVLDVSVFKSPYTLLFFLLSGYLAYTVFAGRNELLATPTLADLIHEPVSYHDLATSNRNMLLPLLDKDLALVGVRNLMTNSDLPVTPNRYIDLDDVNTWYHSEPFEAEFLPVVRDGSVVGVADANELRFWLKETRYAAI